MKNSALYAAAVVTENLTEEGNGQLKRGTTLFDATTGTTYVAREIYPSFKNRDVMSQSFSEMDPKGGAGLFTSKLPEAAEIIWVPDYEVTGL